MVTNTDLYWRYEEADVLAQEPELAEEYVDRFEDIEAKLEHLWWRDTAEWVAEFYRDAYRAREQDEREDSLCNCSNPRCPLKIGQVPYQLRERDTMLDTPDTTPMADLKSYLKTHPQAVIIDEALGAMRDLRAEVSRELVEFVRDARQEVEFDPTSMDDPLVNDVKNPPALDAPEAD